MEDNRMVGPAAQTREVLSFGRFELVPSERLLTEDGVPVELGARTLDTLIALVSRPNEVVGKRELMTKVWPDVIVEEGSLRFHIATLRKVLGDGKDGARYIATLAGRGYCFIASIVRSELRRGNLAVTGDYPRARALPARLARMVGRAASVRRVAAELAASRFVTIVGHGGVGKTTIAVAVAHDMLEAFDGAVLFVDFGMLSDPKMVPASLASALGLAIQSDDPVPSLVAHVRDRRVLLVLDNCEHVIEAAASLAERIFLAAPLLHLLATSREAMRVEGEHVHRLMPLTVPPDDPALTAAVALRFPSTQLFMERATARGARFDLRDADAAIVAGICRKLDGVALAIELAAGRVEAFGLRQTAALLDQRLNLLWPGQRTAPPRQQTLQATLDWSYRLLSEPERVVFRRLAVFVGNFTIEAAMSVVTSAFIDQAGVLAAIDSLVAKSIVAVRPAGAMMRYRLLDTTRAYALEINLDEAERVDLAVGHAIYYRRWLEQTGADWPSLSNAAGRASHLAALSNVRAALDWCFGTEGQVELGISLAVAAAPVFLAMSLLTDCHRWSARAILALGDATRGGLQETHLQAALGVSLMFTHGGSDAAGAALNRSFAIAEQRGDAADQLQVLGPLQMFHIRTGDFNTALGLARRCLTIASSLEDAGGLALAHSLLGISLHLAGDLQGAGVELEAALRHGPSAKRSTTIYLGFESQILAGAILARNLWLQGHPAQAVERARHTVNAAARMDHSLTLAIALVWAISVFLWTGDVESAEALTDWLISRAGSYSLGPYLAVARGFEGELAISRGDASGGIERLRDCLKELHAAPYELLTTPLKLSLVRGLAASGRFLEGLGLIDEAIGAVKANGDVVYMPELLRAKGSILGSMPQPRGSAAETSFLQSLELSRHQGARAWELRTALDLAALWAGQGRSAQAETVLRPVFEQFAQAADTADLQAADQLLTALEERLLAGEVP